ncbi:MAG: D-glycero-beta-D-manno-heptose-7-phosphate kinase [Nitrospirales bacterium]
MTKKFEQYIQRFSRANILVLGDLILDHYIWGKVNRVSPEAPVPVVHVESESLCLGGAANVYRNVVSLGGQADLCGVVGSDEGGHALLKALGVFRRSRGGVVIDASRPTTRKTRVIAHNQQIVRFDVEQQSDLSSSTERKVLRYVLSRLSEISCLVISDYAKGVVTPSLMASLSEAAASHHVPIIVDPKVEHFPHYHGVTAITPNHVEAYEAAGIDEHSDCSIDEIGEMLQKKIHCQAVLITRGEQGMSLYDGKKKVFHIPSRARQVFDVTGAGDTVVSTLSLAISTGASFRDAAFLANQAAGVVVGMVGTASVTQDQLKKALRNAS